MFKYLLAAALIPALSSAAPDARAAYRQEAAVQEVGRLASQFDLLAANVDGLDGRLSRLENAGREDGLASDVAALKGQVADLRAEIERLRKEQHAMREEITADLSKKIKALLDKQPVVAGSSAKPPRSTPPPEPAWTGNYYEHVVEGGQTLSLIAREYKTTVAKIIAANPGLKPTALRVGQKIKVPAEE